MTTEESAALQAQIEKLTFHNRTLLTLIGNLNEDKMQQPSIHEAVILYDLSKEDLRGITKLIQEFTGDLEGFEQQAAVINPLFTKGTIIGILQAFNTSGMLIQKGQELLRLYGEKSVGETSCDRT